MPRRAGTEGDLCEHKVHAVLLVYHLRMGIVGSMVVKFAVYATPKLPKLLRAPDVPPCLTLLYPLNV